MSVPMRKEDFVEKDELIDEELTTADLAQSKRPAGSLLKEGRVKDDLKNDLENNLENDGADPDPAGRDLAQDDRRGPVLAERPAGAKLESGVPDVKATGAEIRGNLRNPTQRRFSPTTNWRNCETAGTAFRPLSWMSRGAPWSRPTAWWRQR